MYFDDLAIVIQQHYFMIAERMLNEDKCFKILLVQVIIIIY